MTLDGHIARGAKVLAVLRKHGVEIDDIAADLPKAIEIAADLYAALKAAALKAETLPPVEPGGPKLLEDLPVKITAQQAATHVARHGLTPVQRARVDRETQLFG